MVSQNYLRFEVGGDEGGVFVAVTHRITGHRLVGRPDPVCGVASTQARLSRELVAEFFVPDDYQFETGRCGTSGRFGTFYRVIHQPSGRSRSIDSLTAPDTQHAHSRLLDSLVEELWHAGLLAAPTRHAAPSDGASDLNPNTKGGQI